MSIARFERVSEGQYQKDTEGFPCAMDLQSIPLPRRATAGSAGYDFVVPVDVTIPPGKTVLVPTGIRACIERGWMLMICPRSSLGRKWGLSLANTMGIIDSDYYGADNEGHILLALRHQMDTEVVIRKGERICQGIFLPVGLAEEEENGKVRTGGYGSTGA
ncbi:MAG: deoxyuridine 5'-triphosphate nucleotidohydrolase [Clostridia bacterium]|nr:deoxyuridine 5'-triphosphate nucleotidohydrolase [Clostridia bacterium]